MWSVPIVLCVYVWVELVHGGGTISSPKQDCAYHQINLAVRRHLYDVISALEWTSVIVIHDENEQMVESSVRVLHSKSISTSAWTNISLFLNNLVDPTRSSGPRFCHCRAALVLGSYSFVKNVFTRVAQFSNGTDSTLTTKYEWLTFMDERHLQTFQTDAKLFENLVVLSYHKTVPCLQSLWTKTPVGNLTQWTLVTSLSVGGDRPVSLSRHDMLPALSFDLGGRTLRVVVKEWYPILSSTYVNGRKVYQGLVMEILTQISQHLNFSYTLVESADDSWGQQLNNGQWNGPIGMLIRKEVDLAAAYFTITAERSAVADPTTPYMYDNSVIVFRQTNATSKGEYWTFFLQPFHSQVYITIAGCFLTVLLLLLSLELYQRVLDGSAVPSTNPLNINALSLSAMVLLHFEILLAGLLNKPCEREAKSRAGRILVVTWLMLGVMLAAIYGSQLTSTLTVTDRPLPFSSLQQLLRQGKSSGGSFTWGVTSGTSLHSMLKTSQVQDYHDYYQQVLEFAKEDPDVITNDVNVHKAKVLAGNYAIFLGSSSTAKTWQNELCDLSFLPEPFRTSAFGFYLQKNSPYTQRFSVQISRMVDSGLIDHWRDKWTALKKQCGSVETGQSRHVMGLRETQSALYMAAIGIGLSALALCAERTLVRLNIV